MSRRGRAQHRVDLTAKALQAEAVRLGWCVAPQDGTIDSTLWQPSTGRIELVDFKSPGGELTPGQIKLVAKGWPIRFVSSLDMLHWLLEKR